MLYFEAIFGMQCFLQVKPEISELIFFSGTLAVGGTGTTTCYVLV